MRVYTTLPRRIFITNGSFLAQCPITFLFFFFLRVAGWSTIFHICNFIFCCSACVCVRVCLFAKVLIYRPGTKSPSYCVLFRHRDQRTKKRRHVHLIKRNIILFSFISLFFLLISSVTAPTADSAAHAVLEKSSRRLTGTAVDVRCSCGSRIVHMARMTA